MSGRRSNGGKGGYSEDRREDSGRRRANRYSREGYRLGDELYEEDSSGRQDHRADSDYGLYEDERDYDRERRIRAQRRADRKARREAQLRRRRRRAAAACCAGIGAIVLVLILVFGTRGSGAQRSSDSVAETTEQINTEATGFTSQGDGDDVSPDDSGSAEIDTDSALTVTAAEEDAEEEDADDVQVQLYSYYETANTILLTDSLTDISIYNWQRHIATDDSADSDESGSTQEDGSDTVYGDSSDETSSEETGQSATDADYIDSQYVLVVNADTGEIVAERNAYEQIIPASMTKVMTLLVAIEAMEDYESALTDTFTITQEITDEAYLSGSSFVGYGVGDVATVEDLLYGTILPSGADAAMALAEYTAGTQEAFVELMNEKAAELGLSATTHFTNVIGLYDDGENYSTPYDMCIIMNAAMDNEYCQAILSQRTWTTQAIMDNPEGTTISNWFLRRAEDHIDNWEILCGKTGFVNESGNCAVSYMKSSVTGTGYIACTALTYSSWRCIYDHAAIYNYYTE